MQLGYDADGTWHPGIGDPTAMGWLTVGAYMVAAWLCASAWRARRQNLAVPDKYNVALAWLGLAIVMFGLGINKQLDLQSWFTQVARDLALAQGWYHNRRAAQIIVIGTLGILAVIGMIAVGVLARGPWKDMRVAGLLYVYFHLFLFSSFFPHPQKLNDSEKLWIYGIA